MNINIIRGDVISHVLNGRNGDDLTWRVITDHRTLQVHPPISNIFIYICNNKQQQQ